MATASEIAWAAGFFEGEGSVIRRPAGGHRNRMQRRLSLVNTDVDVVVRFRDIVGTGEIRTAIPRKAHHKVQYIWTSSRWSEIQRILELFIPQLGARRRAAAEALLADPAGPIGSPPHERCLRGHPLSGVDADVYVYGGYRQCRSCHRALYKLRVDARRRDASALTRQARKRETCIRGHPFVGPGADVYEWNGWKTCRICDRSRRARTAKGKGT